jgi:hypothetical protein
VMAGTFISFGAMVFSQLNAHSMTRHPHYLKRHAERHFDERHLLRRVLIAGRHEWQIGKYGPELVAEHFIPDEGTWRVVVREDEENAVWNLVTVVWLG